MHFQGLVRRDIPDAFPTAGTPAGAMEIAAQIGVLAAEQRLNRQEASDRQARKEAGNTIEDVFGDVGILTLMRLCQVNSSLQLPNIYRELARAPKKQRQGVLQNAITEAGQALGIYHSILVPTGMVDKVMTMEWTSPSHDDFSQGINPFLVGQPTPTEEVQIRQRIHLQSLVYSGSAAPSLADAKLLSAPPAIRMPGLLQDTAYTLASFQVYVHVLLGGSHIVTTYVRQQRNNLDRNLHILQWDPKPHLPALILRHVQRAMIVWASRQRDNTTPSRRRSWATTPGHRTSRGRT
jgi:hypothetical protein